MIILLLALCLSLIVIIVLFFRNRCLIRTNTQTKLSEQKFKDMYYLLYDWLSIRQNRSCLLNWFRNRDYKSVAIYGMGELGEALFNELKESSDGTIDVKYGIDLYANQARTELYVYFPNEELPHADIIIVTPFMYYNGIKTAIEGKTSAEIVSLEDIIYDMLIESSEDNA